MARIKLEVPSTFHFKTQIQVRVTDLNYGGHLGNDALLSLMHESRIQFLKTFGYTEMDVDGVGLIMSDVAVQYKAEAFVGDILSFEMTAYDFSVTSFDIFYYITRSSDKKVIALAKSNMVCFDYVNRKMKDVPERFKIKFNSK